jgi:2-polyprenyl-6-methoxyphenol hydroxylase-like FAD-dependent oxidoreductase
MELQTEVAIVGGGPVGLVLALYLDFYGIKSTLLNTETAARWHPKGNGQNARTMEHYRRLGFSDEVRRLGLPGDHPFDQAYFTRLSSHEIYRFPMPTGDEKACAGNVSRQPDVSRFAIAERVRRCDRRCPFDAGRLVTQDETAVRVHARKTDGSAEAIWKAPYAVACDGARSLIRKTLGIAYEGDVQKKDAYWAGQFFSIHMRIPDLYPKFVGHRRAWMYWAINPDPHTRGVIIALNGVDEFMMLIKPSGGRRDVDTDEGAGWVKRAIGADIPVQVLGHYPWNAGQALVAERYKAGRS